MGGAGKTPVTLALAALLQERGFHPIGLTRGYRGETKGPRLVDSSSDSWRKVGDEALLLAQEMPTSVARQRAKALSLIPSKEQMVVLLDDGHQHVSLHKDLSLLVMNKGQQHGNEQVFPTFGRRITLGTGSYLDWLKPVSFSSHPRFKGPAFSDLSFAEGAEGFRVCWQICKDIKGTEVKGGIFPNFSGSSFYRKEDLKALQKLSHGKKAHLITTEKDMTRLPRDLREQFLCVESDFLCQSQDCSGKSPG